MRYLMRYLAITFVVFLGLNLILPGWLHQEYPPSLGPQFSKSIRMNLQEPINNKKPDVILLGNSIIVNGIDEKQFQNITGLRTLRLAFSGAASAYYYLIMKNIIATASTIPQYVFVFFIDNWLTRPDLLVRGGSFLQIMDEVAGDNETVLLRKAYLNKLDPLAVYLNSHSILFGDRQVLKSKIDARIKYPLSEWFMNCGKGCLDTNLDKAFYYGNMLPNPDSREKYQDEWSGSEWDFNRLLADSFLPDILDVAKQKGIQLIFVREKDARFMNVEDETLDMRRYFQDLEDFLEKEDIPLMDFSHAPALSVELFHDQMHMVRAAQPIFTRLVAEKFMSIVLGK